MSFYTDAIPIPLTENHSSLKTNIFLQNTQERALWITQRVKKLTDQHRINILEGEKSGKLVKFKDLD